MKSSEKIILYMNAFAIFVFVLLSSIFIYMVTKAKLSSYVFAGVVLLFLIFVAAVSYYISKLILSRLFKKNMHLDLMLKDTLHELNIPLSVIKANLQMLSMGDKDEKRVKKYKRIESACEDLYGLYKDVDYYIKKEIKREIRESFEIDEVIKKEIEKLRSIDGDVEINFKETGVSIFCDKRGFSKAIGNLLSNSVKYNKDDNPIDVYTDDKILVIKDRGIGMSEAELFAVFDRYYQGDRCKEGFGIGLNMVKSFCDEHKIFIHIESKKDLGTVVSLDLKNVIK